MRTVKYNITSSVEGPRCKHYQDGEEIECSEKIPIELRKEIIRIGNKSGANLITPFYTGIYPDQYFVFWFKIKDKDKMGDIFKLIETYNAIHSR